MTLLQEETFNKCVVIILLQNFFFISYFFHNHIYLMFLFSFWGLDHLKGNNIISEKMKQIWKTKNFGP